MKIRTVKVRAIRKTLSKAVPALVVVMFLLANLWSKQRRNLDENTLLVKAARSFVQDTEIEDQAYSERSEQTGDESKNEKVLMMRPEKTKTKKVLTQDELFASADAHSEAAMESFVLSEPVVQYEKQLKMKWDKAIKNKKSLEVMPNPGFVFHNKLPKSGSTTMNSLVRFLSEDNKFNFLKVQPGPIRVSDTSKLIHYLEDNVEGVEFKKPFFLLKHHAYFNFTAYGGEQPTYINVVREPISWITSRYYFARFGWERKPGVREDQNGPLSEEDLKMEIEECVQRRLPGCTMDSDYIKFFCGHDRACTNATTYAEKRIAVERAKNNILNNFFVVGILEQFSDTLKVFERLMPNYFTGALARLESNAVQKEMKSTKTSYKKEMSEKSKEFLRNGPFHHEVELYEFAKEIFNKRMKELNIEPTPIEE